MCTLAAWSAILGDSRSLLRTTLLPMPRRLACPGTACVLVAAVCTASMSECVCGAHGVRVCGASP
eukprot:15368549-Alexandrium_andersonii.AAC.1